MPPYVAFKEKRNQASYIHDIIQCKEKMFVFIPDWG